METRIVSPSKALELQEVLRAVNAGTLKAGNVYHEIKGHNDVLLVDAVNAAPFVFVAPNTVHVFPSAPGSGTDHLRKRIEADQLFQQLSERRVKQVATAEMYVVQNGAFFELRQGRFREQLAAGREHPHDVCAIARSVVEMHEMVDKHWKDIDYSAVENPGSAVENPKRSFKA